MLLIRSGSTLVLLFSSGSRYWPAPGFPAGICFSGGGGLEPGARGRVGVQSTNFSPISDCGRIRQLASAAEVLEAGVFDLHRDHGLARDRLRLAVLVAVDLARHRHADRFDFADGGAGDAHFLARDHEAAAVEDPADDVAAAAAAAAGDQHDDDDDRGDQPGCDQPFPHGPGGASAGSHADDGLTPEPAKGGSVNGLEPSGGGLRAAARAGAAHAGGAAEGVVLFARRDRFQLAAAGVALEQVEGELDAGVVAVAVVVAGDLAELAEAVEDVRRVGAGEVEGRLEVGDRLFGVREGLGGALLHRRQEAERFGGVVGEALAVDAEAEVLEDRHRFGEHRAAVRARNGARFLVAGFAVSTSGSRSSSAARRLTKVVLALAHERRQQAQRLVERFVLARRSRRRRCWRWRSRWRARCRAGRPRSRACWS